MKPSRLRRATPPPTSPPHVRSSRRHRQDGCKRRSAAQAVRRVLGPVVVDVGRALPGGMLRWWWGRRPRRGGAGGGRPSPPPSPGASPALVRAGRARGKYRFPLGVISSCSALLHIQNEEARRIYSRRQCNQEKTHFSLLSKLITFLLYFQC